MCERGEPIHQRELRNNNQQDGTLADGDANANEIRAEDEERTGTLSGLKTQTAEQDKAIIWGTDSQCDDPELAEFERLECQELEAYVVEDGEDFVGLTERKEPPRHSSSGCKTTAERKERKLLPHNTNRQEANACDGSKSRDVADSVPRTDLGSETDAFVSCLSNMSSQGESFATAMDTAGRTQTTDSWHVAYGPCGTISEDLTLASQSCNTISERVKASRRAEKPSPSSGISTIQHKDLNSNAVVPSEDVTTEAQGRNGPGSCKAHNEEHKRSVQQTNQHASAVSFEGKGDTGSSDHRGSSTATTTQEESNKRNDKSTQADDAAGVTHSPSKTGTKATTESKAIKKQGSFDNSFRKQNSFDKTSKKQPLFESPLKKQHSFDNTVKKQGSFENTVHAASSSLERRRPWGSPSRAATPASPKMATGSPRRKPPGSPAKVPGVRALSLERGDRAVNQAVKQVGKVGLSSGIPKPVTKEPDDRRSSPPQKPKHVRPKIITYVRKNPQANAQVPDAPQEASTLPQRLASYSGLPAHKDSKVLCSSNLLFDKYRQELQKAAHYPAGAKASSSNATHKLSTKSGSFHEEPADRGSQENAPQEGGSVYRSPRAMRPQLGLGAVTRQPAAKTRGQQPGQRSTTAPNQAGQAAGVPNHQAVSHQDSTGQKG
ncbi:uncharacterized protein LOC142995210 [Genypterus blacodes]|uniref:uncharacterized protein LOC142995210 n=1 Tax=Genypterus blacodes TaxID=154954 RepID=UPI003F757E11